MPDSALTYLIGKVGEESPFLAVIWVQMQARTCFLFCKNRTLVHPPLGSCREDLCCSARPLCWRRRSRMWIRCCVWNQTAQPLPGTEAAVILGSRCPSPSQARGSLHTHTVGTAGQQCSMATLVSPTKRRKISWLHSERWKHKCVNTQWSLTSVILVWDSLNDFFLEEHL